MKRRVLFLLAWYFIHMSAYNNMFVTNKFLGPFRDEKVCNEVRADVMNFVENKLGKPGAAFNGFTRCYEGPTETTKNEGK